MLELIYDIARPAHIAAGIMALFIAPIAMVVQKGGAAHRRWGWIYYWAMAVVFGTTLAMLAYRPNIFMLAVAALSFYAVFSAERVLHMKRPDRQHARPLDYAAAIGAGLIGLSVIGWGVMLLLSPANPYGAFAGLGIFFGSLTLKNAADDLLRFRSPPSDKQFWWFHHMGSMLGSYIGAVTAFSVQTVSRWMSDVAWLAPWAWAVWVLPLALGLPLSMLWERHYRRKFAAGRAPQAAQVATATD